jgi:hypothetical protein
MQWPSAVQRAVFFGVASIGEYLAATRLFGWLVNGAAAAAAFVLTLLTPQAAPDLEGEPPRYGLRILVFATIFAGLVISLGGNAVFTWLQGTFSGADARRYYYSQDTHNLILYAFVAPAYMAASASIVYCALSLFSLTGRTLAGGGPPGRIWPVLRLGLVLSWIVLLSGFVQVNYFNDNIMGLARADPGTLKEVCRDRVFWFVNEVVSENGRTRSLSLNAAGVYYLCMQFCHMAVIAAAVWFMITGMFTLYRLGLDMTPDYLARNGGVEPVRARLRRFTLLEISGKWLALILMIHIYIWRDSCLKGEHNIRVTAMFLLALSLFVLATPRLLIEYRLLKCASAEPGSLERGVEWPDIVDQRDKLMSTIVSCVHFAVQITLALLIAKLITIAIG